MELSKNQTKTWRKTQNWYVNGKKNECEKYQIDQVNKHLSCILEKTTKRFNLYSNEFTDNMHPMENKDGFEWTENLDGYLNYINNNYYFNFKFVCDKGGAQTRSLREVYHFINCQIKYVMINKDENICFINILDGDECYNRKEQFDYLKLKNIYDDKIFIGDMIEFFE